MYELCDTAHFLRYDEDISLKYSEYGNKYHISNKNKENNSLPVTSTYGTDRKNAYAIIEDTLNLRKTEVRDPVEYVDKNGKDKTKYVLNRDETLVARSKQELIEQKFKDWLFHDPNRAVYLVDLYNQTHNNLVVRKYHGDHLTLPELNPMVKLRTHQKDVIAKGLYSGNNLLMAHEVGAGKTYSGIILAHEMKRLGIAKKPLITVPNHLVGQWADSFKFLYPNSNLFIASGKDLKSNKRKLFVSRISTSDYDAIIMPHSSFELIGMSKEYQQELIEKEINDVTLGIQKTRLENNADPWGIKQQQIFKKNLEYRLTKLIKDDKKDSVINFEELGVDALIVDESHEYKNNFSYTTLRVAGLNTQSSQRAIDMDMKAQYINKINNDRGVVYLTGTPISNSLAKFYVIQKILQPKELERRKLLMFDSWVSTFGVVTSKWR